MLLVSHLYFVKIILETFKNLIKQQVMTNEMHSTLLMKVKYNFSHTVIEVIVFY